MALQIVGVSFDSVVCQSAQQRGNVMACKGRARRRQQQTGITVSNNSE